MKSHRRKAQAEWTNVIRDWQASGQSVRKYCQQRGLREARFYWWRKQLELTSDSSKELVATVAGETEQAITFLPVRLREPSTTGVKDKKVASSTDRIEIFLPNGSTVRLNGDISEDRLSLIIQMVAGATC